MRTVFDTDDATVTVADAPSAIEVIKTANPTSLVEPGGDVTFSILINNLSATDVVTINSLTDNLYGDLNGVGTCAVPQTLPVGGSYSCEFTVAVSGSAGDSFTDVVTASGLDDDLIPVSDDDDATVTITAPLVASIQVIKTADPTSIFAGETVNYTYEIVNTGDLTLHGVTLSDDKLGPITLPSAATTLDAGEHAIVTQFAVLTETTTNVATVEALDPLNTPVSDTDDATVTVSTVNHPPVLAAIGDLYLSEGDTLTVPISAADQDVLDTLTFVDTGTPAFAAFTDHGDRSATLALAPQTGDAGDYQMTVTVSDSGSPALDDFETFWIHVSEPGAAVLSLTKTANPTAIFAGDTVEYTYEIVNNGPDPIHDITLTDDKLGDIPLPGGRVSDGLLALYTFDEGSGSTVHDVSGVGTPLDLTIANTGAVSWLPSGGLTFNSATIAASPGHASKISSAAIANNAITVEAWVQPSSLTLSGPARIVTLSTDPYYRNFTMGQDGANFDFRLRTTNTDLNGRNPEFIQAGALSTDLVHLVYTFEGGTGRFYMDGAYVDDLNIGGNLSNWMTGYRFGLGNEFSNPDGRARNWLGTYHLVAVYDHALSAADVQQNYDAVNGAVGSSTILLPSEHLVVVKSAVLNETTTNIATVQGLDPLNAPVFDTDDATVTVSAVNHPPVLALIGNHNIDEGDSLSIPISATDLDAADTLTFVDTGTPAFATFTDHGDRTATLDLAPQSGDVGDYQMTVTVSDSGSPALEDTETFWIRVREPGARVEDGLVVLYDFKEGSGDTSTMFPASVHRSISLSPILLQPAGWRAVAYMSTPQPLSLLPVLPQKSSIPSGRPTRSPSKPGSCRIPPRSLARLVLSPSPVARETATSLSARAAPVMMSA